MVSPCFIMLSGLLAASKKLVQGFAPVGKAGLPVAQAARLPVAGLSTTFARQITTDRLMSTSSDMPSVDKVRRILLFDLFAC
jgi:hypothetical protein